MTFVYTIWRCGSSSAVRFSIFDSTSISEPPCMAALTHQSLLLLFLLFPHLLLLLLLQTHHCLFHRVVAACTTGWLCNRPSNTIKPSNAMMRPALLFMLLALQTSCAEADMRCPGTSSPRAVVPFFPRTYTCFLCLQQSPAKIESNPTIQHYLCVCTSGRL